MGIITRWFAPTAAGLGDGLLPADPAALLPSGNWSSVLTGYDASGADSFVARILGGETYACSQKLEASRFPAAFTESNFVTFAACDSAGDLWVPANRDWSSAQPWNNSTGMVTINTSTNIMTVELAFRAYGIDFTSSARIAHMVLLNGLEWSRVRSSADGAAGYTATASNVINSEIAKTSTSYDYVFAFLSVGEIYNVRVTGPWDSGGSGNRHGLLFNVNATRNMSYITSHGHAGNGLSIGSGGNSMKIAVARSVAAGCGGHGIMINGGNAGGDKSRSVVSGSVAVNNGGWGVQQAGANVMLLSGVRARNNTSGNFDTSANIERILCDTSAGTDGDEFVDYAGRDFRIKNTAAIWGKGYGAGDEPAAGGGGSALHLGSLGQTGIGSF